MVFFFNFADIVRIVFNYVGTCLFRLGFNYMI